MRVRMLRGSGGPDGLACEVGGVYDLPDPVALQFVRIGRAVPVDDAAPVPVVHRDPVAETRPKKVARVR